MSSSSSINEERDRVVNFAKRWSEGYRLETIAEAWLDSPIPLSISLLEDTLKPFLWIRSFRIVGIMWRTELYFFDTDAGSACIAVNPSYMEKEDISDVEFFIKNNMFRTEQRSNYTADMTFSTFKYNELLQEHFDKGALVAMIRSLLRQRQSPRASYDGDDSNDEQSPS